MLETFISSRIKRSLFEYLLAHPNDRFYLRGLAKELGLSVSPLRREIKRLEDGGMLKSFQEGNMLFYTVNQESQDFLRLKQAGSPAVSIAEERPAVDRMPVSAVSPKQRSPSWGSPLAGPALLAAGGVGVALILIVAGLLYFRTTEGLSTSAKKDQITQPTAEEAMPTQASTAVMRGNRWKISGGGFGGFSPATNEESY